MPDRDHHRRRARTARADSSTRALIASRHRARGDRRERGPHERRQDPDAARERPAVATASTRSTIGAREERERRRAPRPPGSAASPVESRTSPPRRPRATSARRTHALRASMRRRSPRPGDAPRRERLRQAEGSTRQRRRSRHEHRIPPCIVDARACSRTSNAHGERPTIVRAHARLLAEIRAEFPSFAILPKRGDRASSARSTSRSPSSRSAGSAST